MLKMLKEMTLKKIIKKKNPEKDVCPAVILDRLIAALC